MAIEIKKLTDKDVDQFSELIGVFKNEFEWNNVSIPDRPYLQKLLENKHFIVFIAVAEDIVVGGLTAYILDRYDSEKRSAYIYDIAVIAKEQRKGIGKSLITTLNKYCRENNFSEVFVQAETDDTHALNFYRKTPITSELNATHFTYTLERNII